MNITPARTEDLNDLARLVAEYQSLDETSDTISDDQLNLAFLNRLLNNNEHQALFIGRTSSGELIGFVHVYCLPSLLEAQRVPRITDLFVHPDYRQQGFGRQLFDHAVRWARSRRHDRVEWYVENMNMPAQYMFDRIEDISQTGWLRYSVFLANRNG